MASKTLALKVCLYKESFKCLYPSCLFVFNKNVTVVFSNHNNYIACLCLHYLEISVNFDIPENFSKSEDRHFSVKARSNGHNILITFVVTCCDHARSNGHNNLTTFQEQNKCCHNIVVRGGQTVSTSTHNKCCDKCCDRLIGPLVGSINEWKKKSSSGQVEVV